MICCIILSTEYITYRIVNNTIKYAFPTSAHFVARNAQEILQNVII